MIFVAGIPYDTKIQVVEASFSEQGYKVRVKDGFTSKSNRKSDLDCRVKTGHCTVSVLNLSMYESILRTGNIYISNRRLMIKPHLSGTCLFKLNAANNKKRILLKHVPAYYESKIIFDLLVKNYGEVQEFFPFMSDTVTYGDLDRKFKSFSVMFTSIDSAMSAIKDSYVQLDKTLVYIEKYQKSKKKCHNHQQISQPNLIPYSMKSRYSVATHPSMIRPFPVINQVNTKEIYSRSSNTRSKSQSSLRNLYKMSNEGKTRSLTRPSNGSGGCMRSELLEELSLRSHHLKPTAPLYRLLRSQNFEYVATFEHRYSWIGKTNFRKNVTN